MAQSFNHIEVSLGEAERQKNGKKWTHKDYEIHQKNGYKIDESMTHLNTVFVSAGTTNERELVNKYFESKMIQMNQAKHNKMSKWNRNHRGKINPKTNKKYHMKSVDKREMYAIGDYVNKGKRKAPYESFMSHINRGNARNKLANKKHRSTVLQQFVVGFGNFDQWNTTNEKDPRYQYARMIKGEPLKDAKGNLILGKFDEILRADPDPKLQKQAVESFDEYYIKPYLERFEKQNPSLHIVQAASHYDETNPHLQFTVLPNLDGKEYGGLGSIAFSDAIMHDHPHSQEYWKNNNVISEFYKNEHLEIRSQIENTKPFEYDDDKTLQNSQMTAGKRPGSHATMPVTKLQELGQKERENTQERLELDNEKQAFEKQKQEQQQRLNDDKSKFESDKTAFAKQKDLDEEELVNASMLTIINLDKHHKVPQNRLKSDEKPQEIQTKTGQNQHRNQGLKWLIQTANKLWDKAKKKMKELVERQKQQDERQKQQDERQKQQDETRRKQIAKNLAQLKRDQRLNDHEDKISNEQLRSKLLLSQCLREMMPNLDKKTADDYASGNKIYNGKTGFALVADQAIQRINSNDPQLKQAGYNVRQNIQNYNQQVPQNYKFEEWNRTNKETEEYYNNLQNNQQPDDNDGPNDDGPDL